MCDGMERAKEIYYEAGLPGLKLQTLNDLQKIHEYDVSETPGYWDLGTENKELFQRFVIDFWNAWGLEARFSVQPTGINWVQERSRLAHKDGEDWQVDTAIFSLNEAGEITGMIRDWDTTEKFDSEVMDETYLRFDFTMGFDDPGWVHVQNGAHGPEWY